jgi:hypothetical protein
MHDDDDDDYTSEELEAVVRAALGELVNIAQGVADSQVTEEGYAHITGVCDVVAEFYQLERTRATTLETHTRQEQV